MSRLFGILSVVVVVLLAMGFAAANSGHRTTLDLGFFTLYQIPVALVAFSGLFVGMLVMFATGIHTDLKVRRILRDRLAQEAEREQTWIDRNQKDLFADGPAGDEGEVGIPGTSAPASVEDPAPSAPPAGERLADGSARATGGGAVGAEDESGPGSAEKEAGPGSVEEESHEVDDVSQRSDPMT